MTPIMKFAKALKFLREALEDKTIPLYWVEFLLLVAECGDKGTTTKEASEYVGMTQGIASRTVSHMSQYWNKHTGAMEGKNLLVALQNDLHYRQRQRLYLTEKGKHIVRQLEKKYWHKECHVYNYEKYGSGCAAA